MELYAILSVDSRSNSYDIGTRSDCLMTVGIDEENKLIKVCLILRVITMRRLLMLIVMAVLSWLLVL